MKIYIIAILLLAFALCFGCKKDEKYWPLGNNWKGTQTFGKVQAFRNGEFWEASGIATNTNHNPFCTISFNTFDSIDSLTTEDLSFSRLPYKSGLNNKIHHLVVIANDPLWADSLYSLYALGYDDLVGTAFYADTTKNNWIQIESIDTIQKIIKGKFDVTYRISPEGEASTNYPREVHFSKGVFEVKVHQ